jgi:hypothetical protein
MIFYCGYCARVLEVDDTTTELECVCGVTYQVINVLGMAGIKPIKFSERKEEVCLKSQQDEKQPNA